MRKQTLETELELNGRKLRINTTNGTRPSYVEVLTAIDDQMVAMLSHHRKVLMVRVDFHTYTYTDNNDIVSDFIRRLRRWAKGKYKASRMGFAWCRELNLEKSDSQHYHLLIMFNGSDVQTSYEIIKKCKSIAENNGSFIPNLDNTYTMVAYDDIAKYADVFYRASYFAKVHTKGNCGETTKEFSTSRIKPIDGHNGKKFMAGDEYLKRIKVSQSKKIMTDAL